MSRIDTTSWRRIEQSVKFTERRLRSLADRARGSKAQNQARWFLTTSNFIAATLAGGVLTTPLGTGSPYDIALNASSTTDTATASGEPDETLSNGLNAPIGTGKIVRASLTGGRMTIDLVWC